MADDQNTSDALDDKYDDIVVHHRGYLEKLQAAFDKHCEEIGADTKKKLMETSEEDKETRKQILVAEKAALDEALNQLKKVVSKSGADVRQKLEEIENQKEASAMDLDAELANL